ncbi:MAG: dTMP kinase [Alphaproteobacteria bacterium]|nr:dTMP kinase [Alphaproteobacteria bacterium]
MGRFLVLEGLDGAGTTTQAAHLATWLRARGRGVVETREPTDGPVGRLIRATLRREEGAPAVSTLPWMFAADRADHLQRVVEPALASDRDVVSDRYRPSSLAYQSLELPLERVDALNRWFRAPDLLVFLDVPVEVCVARIVARGAAREVFEEQALLERIAAAYDRVLAHEQAAGVRVARVDGQGSVEAVAARVQAVVAALDAA